jgi:sugar lactone lactonase YvrE
MRLTAPEPVAVMGGLLEAPCVHERGIAFSDALAGGVFHLRPGGSVRTLLERRRGVGGLAGVHGGGLALSGRDLSLLRHGELSTWHADPSVTGFNDLTATPEGDIVVGALRYRPLAGEDPVPGDLRRVAADGSWEILADDLIWPNGVVVTDAGTILVSDYERRRVMAYPTGEVFVEVPEGNPDGLALDAEGALWIAAGAAGSLTRVRADGTVDAVVDVPAEFVTSLCFAGPALDDVYITTAGALLRARAEVPGAAVPEAAQPPAARR